MAIFVPDGATVLNSLSDVVVPAGTPPGTSFTVYVKAKPKDGRQRCKATELWAASGSMPAQQSQAVTIVTGWRYKHRPSMRAKEAGGTHAKAIDHIESIPYTAAAWSTNEPAPFEMKEEDIGWLPGPVGGDAGRSRPRFQHAGPHCRLPRITRGSSARTIMKELCWFPARAAYVLEKTKAKAKALLAGKTKLDGIDRAWRASDTTVDHLELHLVAKIRIARLNPAINSDRLWDESDDLFDSKLFAALPHDCYRWLNRYMSFGDYGADASVRFTSFTLPAGVRKILISNPEARTMYPEDRSGAIARRLTVRHVTHKLYTQSATPAAAAQPAPVAQPVALTPATQQAVPAAIAAWQAPGASP